MFETQENPTFNISIIKKLKSGLVDLKSKEVRKVVPVLEAVIRENEEIWSQQ